MKVATMFEVPRIVARYVVAVAVLASACGGSPPSLPGDAEADYAAVELAPVPPPEPPRVSPPEPVERQGSLVAEAAVSRVPVFRQPGSDEPFVRLDREGRFGEPRVFLVREERAEWLRALLPMEPNGSEGWIRARDVALTEHPYRVWVDLNARRLTVLKRDRIILRETVAVGNPATPTPTGLFFTTVLVEPNDPSGPYGRFAYGLSAYSEVYEEFAGGDGQVAIHGTNAPSLIGQAVSHGCIRMENRAITRLARLVPLGTPVRITG
jgi:lipoprotein-anchoring transpeptidase ErfK/SrfK